MYWQEGKGYIFSANGRISTISLRPVKWAFVVGRAKSKLMEIPVSKSKTSAHCWGQYYQHRLEICWVIICIIISFGSSVGRVIRVVENDSVWVLRGNFNYSCCSVCGSLLEQINALFHTQYATIHLENVFLYTALRSSELISFHLSRTTIYFYFHAQTVIIALALNLNIVFKELDNLKGYHPDLLY